MIPELTLHSAYLKVCKFGAPLINMLEYCAVIGAFCKDSNLSLPALEPGDFVKKFVGETQEMVGKSDTCNETMQKLVADYSPNKDTISEDEVLFLKLGYEKGLINLSRYSFRT